MLSKLRKFKEIFTTVLVGICAIICFVILIMNVIQVIIRYLTDAGFHYTEDVTVIGMLWIMGLGISIGWINNEHLVINVIDRLISEKQMERLMFVLDVFGIAVGIAMIYFGRLSQIVNTGFTQSVIGFDESFRYYPLIVGGALTVVAAIERIWEQILVWKEGGEKE